MLSIRKTISERCDVIRTVKAIKRHRNHPLSDDGWGTTRGRNEGSNGYTFIDFARDDCLASDVLRNIVWILGWWPDLSLRMCSVDDGQTTLSH